MAGQPGPSEKKGEPYAPCVGGRGEHGYGGADIDNASKLPCGGAPELARPLVSAAGYGKLRGQLGINSGYKQLHDQACRQRGKPAATRYHSLNAHDSVEPD